MRQIGKRWYSVNEVEVLLAERDALREALQRLVADLETNTESGAPDYAHEALVSQP